VRLLRGEFSAETRYRQEPLELLRNYAQAGVRWLHLVDLDGARDGIPGNQAVIRKLCEAQLLHIQLGGGLRTAAAIDAAFDAGVDRVVLGSAAVEHPELLRNVLRQRGADAACLAVDVRVDATGTPRVRTKGWVQEHALSLWELLDTFADTRLQHVLCTDIERDGAMAGPGVALYAAALRRYPRLQWQASGGIRSAADLDQLAAMGLAAAISGKALLEGHLRLEELQPYLPAA
jgi:phosphoribosylformimino-5-aminoimidazole carboxamide ribotide isomerase